MIRLSRRILSESHTFQSSSRVLLSRVPLFMSSSTESSVGSAVAEIKPYLNFNGNCKEVLNFYKDCLGGEVQVMTFAGTPMEANLSTEDADKVMHGWLEISTNCKIMASDSVKNDIDFGDNIAVSLNCVTDAQVCHAFEKLSAGGKVQHPLAEQFWGGKFGQFTDKFGVLWMCHWQVPPKDKESEEVKNDDQEAKRRKIDESSSNGDSGVDMTGVNIHPYILFNDSCRDAITFYHGILGGKIDVKSFKGSPMDSGMSEEDKERLVLHSSLMLPSNKTTDSADVMASDCGNHSCNSSVKMGNNVALSMLFKEATAVTPAFNQFSEGGKVVRAPEVMFWGAYFGQCYDKYGLQWLFVGPHKESNGKDCGDEKA